MTKTIHCIVSVATVVAILAVTRIAAAQALPLPGNEDAATDAQLATECLVECNKRIVPCASAPTDVMLACADIPACIGMSNSYVEIINMTCDRCRAGERDCVTSEAPPPAPAPTVVLTPWAMPTATAPAPKPMPAPPLSKEQLCKQQGGIMSGTACWKLEHAKKEIEKLQADLAALQKRVDDQGNVPGLEERLRRINDRLSALEGAVKGPADGVPPNGDLTLKELNERVRRLQDTFDTKVQAQVQALSNRDTERDNRLNQDEAKIQELEDRISGVFAFELGALGNVHVLKPFEMLQFGIGPYVSWDPGFTDRWHLKAEVGIGYAGHDRDGRNMMYTWTAIGLMPNAVDGLYIPFGFIGEWRNNAYHRVYDSYGGFGELMYCPGDDGAPAEFQEDAPFRSPHHICIGVRAALEATRFQGRVTESPDSGQTHWYPDGSFSLKINYAFLP